MAEPTRRGAKVRCVLGGLGSALGTCATLVVWTLGSQIDVAAAQEAQCIPDRIERELFACDGRTATLRRPGSAPGSLGQRSDERAAPPAPTPGLAHPSDRRAAPRGMRERSERLLSQERSTLERLLSHSAVGDERRPRVLERLEATCSEQAYVADTRVAELEEPIFVARRAGRMGEVQSLARRQAEQRRAAREARECSIRALAILVRDHPNAPRLDRSLYALASSLERIGQAARARQVYLRLIRDFPASEHVPHAYLAFAEHHFERGELGEARQFYERVLTIEPARNSVYGYAQYKLAWVLYNLDDFAGALSAFVRVLEHTRAFPDEPSSPSLARQARRELVLPYARVGSIDRALAFFRRVSASDDEAYEMLESLGTLYHDNGEWPRSIAVHHRLMADRAASDELCEWQLRILDATVASRPKPEQRREAERTAALRATYAAASHPAERIRRCDDRTAVELVTLAVAWHREAIGTETAPGTRDARTMDEAIAVYDLALDQRGLASLPLDGIDRRDRPSLATLRAFRADLLFERERFREAAADYARVAESTDDPELAANAAYGAVLAYDRVLGARAPSSRSDDASLRPRELDAEEQRMAAAFARFACVAGTHEELPIVLYRWARLYYEANQFERAAVLFERIATHHATSEVALYAANLWLDSVGVLLERRGNRSCATELASALDPLERGFCADPGAQAANGELCTNLVANRCGLEERRIRGVADAGDPGRAGSEMLTLIRQQHCARAPELLYTAAQYFETARLLGRAIRVRQALVQSYPDHPLAVRSVYLIGASYHALAIYGEAADYYERYAAGGRCDPDASPEPCPNPAVGLANAVTFRLGLGDPDRARADAHTLEQRFARSDPRAAAEASFTIGGIEERAERWPQVIDHHRAFVRRYASVASPAVLARAHMRIARGWIAQGRRDRAQPSLTTIDAIGASAPEDLDATEAAHLADAVAEARFEAAESSRERFEALRFPTLRGGASMDRVQRWAQDEFRPWMGRKREMIAQAEAAYGRVSELASPRWRIAAASRLGDMYLSLVDQIRGAPVPEAIARDPELERIYWDNIDDATEPIVALATQRYEHCLSVATQVRWFDASSSRCERTLNELDPGRYPIAAELRRDPELVPSDPARPGVPASERLTPPG
ncbi:MAG: tol-pal system YbgF family protein [Sandaracinaceae bacterium]